jgi:hypothetical protein
MDFIISVIVVSCGVKPQQHIAATAVAVFIQLTIFSWSVQDAEISNASQMSFCCKSEKNLEGIVFLIGSDYFMAWELIFETKTQRKTTA